MLRSEFFVCVGESEQTSPELGRICNRRTVGQPIVSSSQRLLVTFVTDSTVNASGFAAAYRTGE